MARPIVFAKTRHHYDSYLDFFRLVAAAGFPVRYLDEIELDRDVTYVFTPYNGEAPPVLDRARAGRRAKLVWWNLERAADDTLARSLDTVAGAVDAVWVSDRAFAKADPRFTYVPIAGERGIARERPAVPVRYNVCPLSYLWGRRQAIIHQLDKRGLRIAPMAFGQAAQDDVVPYSGVILNLHQYEGTKTIAPLRFAVAASYAVPIISEAFSDPEALGLVIAAVPYGQIVETTALLCHPARAGELAEAGQRLHRRLCDDTSFGREVDLAAALL